VSKAILQLLSYIIIFSTRKELVNTFDHPLLLPAVQNALKSLGFSKPTEIQEKIIPVLLENYKQDVHAQAQTGTGKTLAFGIPLLHAVDPSAREVQALVMAPTRELVLQIFESLKDVSRGTNISIEPIYGGMPIDRQISALKRGVQIIIGTPGRINDHLRRKTLNISKLKVLVLDEADIMLDMGFREEIDAILEYAPKNRSIWLFSATVMPGLQKLIKSHLKNPISVRITPKEVASAKVKQFYCLVPQRKRILALTRFIDAAPDFYSIIFCRTKTLTSEVTEELASKGFKVNCLHGDMKQGLRNHVIKGFKNKDFNILVATDVAARGIDVSDLTHVINYSIPDDTESYVHRIGRTGRAGKEGIAITFISPSELYRMRQIEKVTKSSIVEIPVPPVDSIINVKMAAVSDFIEQAKKIEVKPSPVDKTLQELITSFSEQELRDAFILMLKEKFFQGINEEHDIISESASVSQEICVELGQEHGLYEEKVRSYLYTTCELLPQEVTKARVLKNRTFISIPENRLKNCLAKMQKNPIMAKRHKVYLVQDVFKKNKKRRR
jgi:ATP-dependent RNA helicase DeaD